ncbi:MAG: SDR family NAD(P)-dependent oxidoreductase [Betaproteobacteria bacterium]
MSTLDGKVAVITGGGSGIGEACAELFVQEGARVFLSGRREDPLKALVAKLGKDKAAYITGDVSKPEDNQRLFEAATKQFGGVDIFLANAGVEGAASSIPEYSLEVFDEVIAVNVRGVFLGLKYAIPALQKRGGGSIVITSSIAGIKARGTGNSAYVTSKHAEIGMMRSAAAECAPLKIRVNAVLPGPTDTRMIHSIEESRSPGAPEKARAAILAGLPLQRYGTSEEIANLIAFLASDNASICTGGVFIADGGLSAI